MLLDAFQLDEGLLAARALCGLPQDFHVEYRNLNLGPVFMREIEETPKQKRRRRARKASASSTSASPLPASASPPGASASPPSASTRSPRSARPTSGSSRSHPPDALSGSEAMDQQDEAEADSSSGR